jgi:hypothetical protein
MGDYQLCGFNSNHNKCVVNQKEREGKKAKAIYITYMIIMLYIYLCCNVYMSHIG